MPFKNDLEQREYQKEWIKARRLKFLGGLKCEMCRTSNNIEIHHKDPEIKVSHRIWSWSEDRIKEELKKCQVLCNECHKSIHNEAYFNLIHGTYTMCVELGCRCMLCARFNRVRLKRRR